jgi:hypothetical protein
MMAGTGGVVDWLSGLEEGGRGVDQEGQLRRRRREGVTEA